MIIADTGFWIALANKNDDYHQRAVNASRLIQNERLITTCAVMTETCHLLLNRLGVSAQQKFIKGYAQNLWDVFELKFEHAPKIAGLMEQYASLPMDLADASLVILAEYLGCGRILSTDQRDFNTYRWKQREPFKNLLI